MNSIMAFVAASATLIVAASPATIAADWPTKPVRLLVGFAPGGGTDTTARAISQKLTASLGSSALVLLAGWRWPASGWQPLASGLPGLLLALSSKP